MEQLHSLAQVRSFAKRRAAWGGILQDNWKKITTSAVLFGVGTVALTVENGPEVMAIGAGALALASIVPSFVVGQRTVLLAPVKPKSISAVKAGVAVALGLVLAAAGVAYAGAVNVFSMTAMLLAIPLPIIGGSLIGRGICRLWQSRDPATQEYADRVMGAYAFAESIGAQVEREALWDYRFMVSHQGKTANFCSSDSLCLIERYHEDMEFAALAAAADRDIAAIQQQRAKDRAARNQSARTLTPVDPNARAKPQRNKADVQARLAELERALGN